MVKNIPLILFEISQSRQETINFGRCSKKFDTKLLYINLQIEFLSLRPTLLLFIVIIQKEIEELRPVLLLNDLEVL